MYKYSKPSKGKIKVNNSYEGERLEEKIFRITNNNEPISDGAPIIYTERKEGVQPAYNIRTDRFEVAVEAMDKVQKSHKAKREGKPGGKKVDKMPDDKTKGQGDSGAEPIQATT